MPNGQVTIRVGATRETELDAIAGQLEITKSELVREMVEDGLPAARERARVAAATRTGTTADEPAIRKATAALLADIAANVSLTLPVTQLYGAKSRALHRLLSVLWGEDDASAAVRAKILGEVKPHLSAPPAAPPSAPPPDDRPKGYSRRHL